MTITVPQQLKNELFIVLGVKAKEPLDGIAWSKPEEQHDAEWIEKYCNNSGSNYGVIYSNDTNLCVIDADKIGAFIECLSEFNTYTVKSGRDNANPAEGGAHFYFHITDAEHKFRGKKLILFKDGYEGEIGDIRFPGFRGYNVAPYSIHPKSSKPYLPINEETPVRDISIDEILDIFKENGIEYKAKEKPVSFTRIEAADNGLDDYPTSVMDWLRPDGAHITTDGEYEGSHPIHGSTTGTNLTVSADGKKWWCRRCHAGGGIIKAIAVAKNIIDCSDANGDLTQDQIKECYKYLNERYPEVAAKHRAEFKQRKHEEQLARIAEADKHADVEHVSESSCTKKPVKKTGGEKVVAKVNAKKEADKAAKDKMMDKITGQNATDGNQSEEGVYLYTLNSQKSIREFVIDTQNDKLMYHKSGKQWYVKDHDGYCFRKSDDNGYAEISSEIFAYVEENLIGSIRSSAEKCCTKSNISGAIDLAKDKLEGLPEDIAYVFDGGKTMYVYQDENLDWKLDMRDTPYGLNTTLRVHGEYWKGTLSECPDDFKEWINAYGTPEFIEAILRIFSRALLCRPDKLCFQFVSEDGNTGKSTLSDCLGNAWGDTSYTRIQAAEIMKNRNSTGRRTALLQAVTKPFTVINEAEGKIDEGTYKELIDTTPTFSGNYCGRDRIEVPRRSCVFIESNKLIRATNTSAYANRTFPIEFNRVFPMDDKIRAKIMSREWQKYARGILIDALEKCITNLNAGKNIETQIAEICPALIVKRNGLIMEQDFLQSIIASIIEPGVDEHRRVKLDDLWGKINDYAKSISTEIKELGIRKDALPCDVTAQSKRYLAKELRRMGYEVVRTSEYVVETKDRRNYMIVENAKYTS